MLPIYQWNSPECDRFLSRISQRGSETDPIIEKQVFEIIAAVRSQGDSALREFTSRFDGFNRTELRISAEEIARLAASVGPDLRRAIQQAARNIRDFHLRQKESTWEFDAGLGVRLGQRIRPLNAVGLYVPGGTAAYPSTVMMNAIPAQIAGVPRLVITTPYHQFQRNPVIAAVMEELELKEVYGVGGAQAIAALAYGTESIARVDKIVGPGNIYVATAKRQVFGAVDIDMIAGPSEVVIVADSTAPPAFVAADLMAQAEHDPDACAIAIMFSPSQAGNLQQALRYWMEKLPRKEIILKSLINFGGIILVENRDEASAAVNAVAPEHLELLLEDPEDFSIQIHSAGAIFFGPYSCEAVGDYFAGPNHVLPTSGTARFASPLGVYDFLKRTSLIHYSCEALEKNRAAVELLARSEKLDAHALSVVVRFEVNT
jgi:histidinol dehydrogenase